MKDGRNGPIIELGDLFNRLSNRVYDLEELLTGPLGEQVDYHIVAQVDYHSTMLDKLDSRIRTLEETAATREQLNKAHDRLTITVQHLNEGLAELFRRLDEKDGNK